MKIIDIAENYVRSVHPDLVRYVAYMTGAQIALHGSKVSEYDIQYLMYSYLNNRSGISQYSSEREKSGRFDNCIFDNTTKRPIVVYELKSFIKSKEVIRDKFIAKDILKLGKYRASNPEVRTYFILISKSKKVEKCILSSSLLAKYLFNERRKSNRKFTKLQLKWFGDYVKADSDKLINKIKLRPSTKHVDKLITCYSWEILVNEKLTN